MYECYADGNLLFRSIGCISAALDPIPQEPEFRRAQSSSRQEGKRLTYAYVATGLSEQEAKQWLAEQALNTTGAQHKTRTSGTRVSEAHGSLNTPEPGRRQQATGVVTNQAITRVADPLEDLDISPIDWLPTSGISRLDKRGRLV